MRRISHFDSDACSSGSSPYCKEHRRYPLSAANADGKYLAIVNTRAFPLATPWVYRVNGLALQRGGRRGIFLAEEKSCQSRA
jgi:hypothetical protein